MADFIFRVSSAKLTDAQKQQIAGAIQATVLHEIAKLDLGASPAPDCLFRPIKWAGGIMIPPGEIASAATATLTVTAQTAT